MKRKINNNSAGSRSAVDGLYKVIIAILSVILVVMIVITAVKINSSFSEYVSTPNDLLRTIKNGYYPDALSEMYDNIALGETSSKNSDYIAPYALLDYYEAESYVALYKSAAKQAAAAGDKQKETELLEKVSVYQGTMDAARNGMGEIEFMTEEIDGIFAS